MRVDNPGLVSPWAAYASQARSAEQHSVQTVDQIHSAILGENPSLTIVQVAEQVGTDPGNVRRIWRAMGFANVSDDAVIFVSGDVDAFRIWVGMVERGEYDESTMLSLVRAQSHNIERLVLWQLESSVQDLMRRHDFDDTAARIIYLNQLRSNAANMIAQLAYQWRRQAVDLAQRTMVELAQRVERPPAGEVLPLPRALGFVDMVSFTSRARQLEYRDLVDLVEGFELTARDVISANGARIVKTVGDAVLYVADDLLAAANVALAMIEAVSSNPTLLPVRASLVWGRVISRSGDIFGPAVNLASRLIDIAPRDTVYMDGSTAALLSKHPRAADFLMTPRPATSVPGIGEIQPIELRWAAPPSPTEIWLPGN